MSTRRRRRGLDQRRYVRLLPLGRPRRSPCSISGDGIAVLGNHDSWVLDPDSAPADIAGDIARYNAVDLAPDGAAALSWLGSLAPMQSFERDGWRLTLAHGTPDDPLEGRYYPDDRSVYDWLPRAGRDRDPRDRRTTRFFAVTAIVVCFSTRVGRAAAGRQPDAVMGVA